MTTPRLEGRLEGRVAIVTGASRGIGAGLARVLAREGAAVAVAARTEQVWDERLPGTIHETVAAIRQAGGHAIGVRCDLAVDEDIDRLFETVTAQLGAPDLLVNNAAVTAPGRPPRRDADAPLGPTQVVTNPPPPPPPPPPTAPPTARGGFLAFPLKGYRLHFQVDVFAAYRLMQLVLPAMIERGRGSILNITSDASRRPGEGPYEDTGGITTFAYGGAKIALEHLTQAVALEVQPHGVGVNALMPSLPVATPGLLVQTPVLGEEVSLESFCEAAVRLLLEPASRTTGRVAYSEDVLRPELGRRGWLGSDGRAGAPVS